MENKERLNLNPEAEENKVQEENAAPEMDAINNEETNLPEETQDALLNENVDDVVAEEAIEPIEEPVVATVLVNEPEIIIETEPSVPVEIATPIQNEIVSEQDTHTQIHHELLAIELGSVVEEEEEEEEIEDDSNLNYESF